MMFVLLSLSAVLTIRVVVISAIHPLTLFPLLFMTLVRVASTGGWLSGSQPSGETVILAANMMGSHSGTYGSIIHSISLTGCHDKYRPLFHWGKNNTSMALDSVAYVHRKYLSTKK